LPDCVLFDEEGLLLRWLDLAVLAQMGRSRLAAEVVVSTIN